jgi:hypothetical protein
MDRQQPPPSRHVLSARPQVACGGGFGRKVLFSQRLRVFHPAYNSLRMRLSACVYVRVQRMVLHPYANRHGTSVAYCAM